MRGMYARRRRHNPAGGKVMQYAIAGASVVGGAVGSKALTQLILQSKNTGAMGYAGNIGATIALGYGAHLFFRDKSIATMVVAGGIAQLIVRILTDQTPYGQALSGAGLGDYQTNWNFVWPQRVGGGYPPSMILPPGSSFGQPATMPVVTHNKGVGALLAAPDWN